MVTIGPESILEYQRPRPYEFVFPVPYEIRKGTRPQRFHICRQPYSRQRIGSGEAICRDFGYCIGKVHFPERIAECKGSSSKTFDFTEVDRFQIITECKGRIAYVKISTNTPLAEKKPGWIDFDAGTTAAGEPVEQAARRLFRLVLDTAGGAPTRSEAAGRRGIAIFKDGVTL